MSDLGAITTRAEAVKAVEDARYDLETAVLYLNEWDRIEGCKPNCGPREEAV